MTFQQAIITCLRKYFTFSGRARRSEYWWFVLFCFLGGFVTAFVESFINGVTGTADGPTLLSGAFNLATFIPSLAVGWRRMHDTGRSGLYLFYPMFAIIGFLTFLGIFARPALENGDFSQLSGLIGVVAVIASIVVIVSPFVVLFWLTRPSQSGQNQYGPNPHEVPT